MCLIKPYLANGSGISGMTVMVYRSLSLFGNGLGGHRQSLVSGEEFTWHEPLEKHYAL